MTEQEGERLLLEVGWILVGPLDETDQSAFTQAREEMLTELGETFPQFEWRMPVIRRREVAQAQREEPVILLDYGANEQEARHWDYAFVLTGTDLRSYYKPYTLATPARSMNVAVLSTLRIDPQATRMAVGEDTRLAVLKNRIKALAMHQLGHLNGLQHDEEETSYMHEVRTPMELDQMDHFSEEDLEWLIEELNEVADVRLEEQVQPERVNTLLFYLRAGWIGRDDIFSAVRQIKPWRFPFRLSRLTTAAASTLLVLIITAEAWDLGMSRSPTFVAVFSLVTLILTSVYILLRQQLLQRRGLNRLTEQAVVTNISISVVVVLGMLSTYLLLFAFTLLLAQLLFNRALVEGWAVSLEGDVRFVHYLLLAGFVASMGITIGALGASFEGQHYFRHIAYVDEET